MCKDLRFIFKKRSEAKDCMKFKISPIKIKTIRENFVNVTDNEKVQVVLYKLFVMNYNKCVQRLFAHIETSFAFAPE